MDGDIIHYYGLQQAIEDGILIPVILDRIRLIPPQPIIVTTVSVAEAFDQPTLQHIWDAYCAWFATAHELPEVEQLFTITVEGKKVWVIEDESVITILFPEDW